MIKCEHKDCDYEAGWTHENGGEGSLVEPSEGDFYKIVTGYDKAVAHRFHGDDNEMELLGCPKCLRLFMSAGESYLDAEAPNLTE